jgi:hypothetical protein
MRLVLREKYIQEREVAGSSLENQVFVSSKPIGETISFIEGLKRLPTFNRRHTKPAGLYTSSAYKEQSGKTSSQWAEFMRSEQFGTFGSIVMFKVDPSAKIAIVENIDDYMELLYQYDYNPLYPGEYGAKNLNWDGIAKDFDGFRITSEGYSAVRDISYGWDVEQTVFFNTGVLKLIPRKQDSEITAPKGSPEYLNQKYNYIEDFDTQMRSYGNY